MDGSSLVMIAWYGVVGLCLMFVGFCGVVAYFAVTNYNINRDIDALKRANKKMQDYIAKRDKDGWDKPFITRQPLDTDTRIMTTGEIADLKDPVPLASRVRSKPRPRPKK